MDTTPNAPAPDNGPPSAPAGNSTAAMATPPPTAGARPTDAADDAIAPAQATRDDGHTDHLNTEASSRRVVPELVTARFLKVGDSYFFPDRTLAFVDTGVKLKAHTHNAEVIRSLVAIAQTRGWDEITVTGAEAFRRAIWQEATARGMDVHGYRATGLEHADMQRMLRRAQGPLATRPADQSTAAPHGEPEASEGRLAGRLIGHGAAPYKHDPQGRLSYFIKVRNQEGDHTLWGVDLERALVESRSRVQIGDVVAVENRGAQRVKLKVPRRNSKGELIGERVIETHRNHWLIETPAWFAQREAQAAALRDANTPTQDLARHGELHSAAMALRLGELFVEQNIEHTEDRTRVLQALRERLARHLERGEEIRLPLVRERAREEPPSPEPASRAPRGRVPVRDTREPASHVRE